METTPVCLTANKLTLCRSAAPWQIGGFRFWISRFWPTKCWTGVYRLIGFSWSKWARYWCPSCTVKHDGFSIVRLDFSSQICLSEHVSGHMLHFTKEKERSLNWYNICFWTYMEWKLHNYISNSNEWRFFFRC